MSIPSVPTGTVEIPEIPLAGEMRLPASQTALVIVDMQNDFVKEGGTLVVEAAAETVPHIQSLLRSARAAGVHIAYTQDSTMENDLEFEIWPEHCRIGSWGWEIIDELKPQEGELICRKNRYDGFYGTWLGHFLGRVWHVKHVVIVGTVANICVAHTAASAGLRWYHIVMPANGVSALTEFDQALTLRQVSWLYGGHVVRDVKDVVFER
jgi:nicotinamidase-related amidase